MCRIVFLDFDGVLNSHAFTMRKPCAGVIGLDSDAVALLNDLLARTGAMVVVTSVWRLTRSRTELCDELLEVGFLGMVLDKTPHLNSRPRGAEIQRWLDGYAATWRGEEDPVESMVILDDDSDMAHLAHCLVKTDITVGLTAANVERAVKMLEGL
jgi:hypothetical protein